MTKHCNSPFLFQHTAARRRLRSVYADSNKNIKVSTHSRAEAAAKGNKSMPVGSTVSTHSRAEAAANGTHVVLDRAIVSTHSRAEAAAFIIFNYLFLFCCFNTQPRGGGCC